jgi:tryptophan synthase beta chain
MRLLGAQVVGVESGSRTLKDAINEAMRDWSASVRDTHYLLGSVLGPHPYPSMVGEFHAVIGREARAQVLEREGRLPDLVVACVGGGSNAIGIFRAFLDDSSVALIGVEAAGEGIASGRHAARFSDPSVGVLHGTRTLVLQDDAGQIRETHSISAGLDYPAVGPEHAALEASGRTRYASAEDHEAVDAFLALARTEGILPALESSHALAYLRREGPRGALGSDPMVIVNLSGRGDKDLAVVERWRAAHGE